MHDQHQDAPGVKVPPPLVFAGAFGLGMLLQKLLPLPRPQSRPAGTALVAGGLALGGSASLLFLRRGTTVLPMRPNKAFVTDGPFQISRNPMYAGLVGVYTGASLLRRSVWPLLLLPAVIFTVQKTAIEPEEAYLQRRFGAEYAAYKANVRRWL